MREYRFSSSLARDTVDLTEFEAIIRQAVEQVNPKATVTVYTDRYTIDNISRSEAVQVGRLLSKTALAEYCIKVEISRLFFGQDVKEDA